MTDWLWSVVWGWMPWWAWAFIGAGLAFAVYRLLGWKGALAVLAVTFGGVAATDVVVNSTTSITCTTPAHEAYPTALVSIEVTNDDGLSGSLAAAFTFTTP